MPHCPVVVLGDRNHGTYRVTRKEAGEMVADGLAKQISPTTIELLPVPECSDRPSGRLSMTVGAPLANDALRGEGWALTAIKDIRGRR